MLETLQSDKILGRYALFFQMVVPCYFFLTKHVMVENMFLPVFDSAEYLYLKSHVGIFVFLRIKSFCCHYVALYLILLFSI